MNTLTKSPIFAANYKKDYMKRTIFFVFFASLLVFNISAQNWDINTLHKINSWDGKFIRNYNKIISRTEPYIAVGVPVAMALAAWVKKDRFEPAHALALWLKTCENQQDYPADSGEISAYLRGDVVPSTQKGWCLVSAGGYSIGWGKGDGRVLKNHYPKGLRR